MIAAMDTAPLGRWFISFSGRGSLEREQRHELGQHRGHHAQGHGVQQHGDEDEDQRPAGVLHHLATAPPVRDVQAWVGGGGRLAHARGRLACGEGGEKGGIPSQASRWRRTARNTSSNMAGVSRPVFVFSREQ